MPSDDVIEAFQVSLGYTSMKSDIRRALGELEAMGWKLVPRDPSEAIWRAGLHCTGPAPAWRSMWDAAPSAKGDAS